eukprot:NODE_3634_length_648_cov_365.896494_g1942_i1.p1 GENE.NODE_3634_length_648_cov_365.896494_g1942_i1~~NODE_3634_length_648_cov_365.896494_g1942_i1.p1  ORF type:complete len:128 (-),score=31.12 NODE_3634_length_648_cov_365.896494_g1942_i1:103-486(-)
MSREKTPKRENNIINMLSFIHTSCWKTLFGKAASGLEKISDEKYTIVDDDLMVTRYISVPGDLSGLSCAAFVAGIVRAILDNADFTSKVTAIPTPTPELPNQTRILVEFDAHVISRDQRVADLARRK